MSDPMSEAVREYVQEARREGERNVAYALARKLHAGTDWSEEKIAEFCELTAGELAEALSGKKA